MIIQSKLNDDVASVVKGFITPFNRFKMLRDTYSNRFLISVLERRKYKQLELIHSKLVKIIKYKFRGFEYFFNTIGLKVEPLKYKHIIYSDNLYSWIYLDPKTKKIGIIKKIVDIFQRIDDVVSLKSIECLISTYRTDRSGYYKKIVVMVNKLYTHDQEMLTEMALSILCLLAYISKK